MTQPPTDHRRVTRLLIVLGTTHLIEVITWLGMNAFTPLFLMRELDLPPETVAVWTGLIASATLLMALPMAPVWGALADRYSRRRIILFASLIQFTAYLLMALSPTIWVFLVARILYGLSFGSVPLMIASIAAAAPAHRVSSAIGIFNTVGAVGISVGPVISALLVTNLGLRGLFFANVALEVVALLCLGLFFRERHEGSGAPSILGRLASVGKLVGTTPVLRWNFLTAFFIALGMMSVEPFVPLIIQRAAEPAGIAPETAIGAVLTLNGLTAALLTPVVGFLGDRIAFTRIIPLIGIAGALILLALTFPLGFYGVAAFLVLRAVPLAFSTTALFTHLAQHVEPAFRSSVLSLATMPRITASLVGPTLSAAVSTLGLSAVLVLAAGHFFISTASAIQLRRVSDARAAVSSPARDRG